MEPPCINDSSLFSGPLTWHNLQSVVRSSFRTLYDAVKAQNEALRALERKMETKADQSTTEASVASLQTQLKGTASIDLVRTVDALAQQMGEMREAIDHKTAVGDVNRSLDEVLVEATRQCERLITERTDGLTSTVAALQAAQRDDRVAINALESRVAALEGQLRSTDGGQQPTQSSPPAPSSVQRDAMMASVRDLKEQVTSVGLALDGKASIGDLRRVASAVDRRATSEEVATLRRAVESRAAATDVAQLTKRVEGHMTESQVDSMVSQKVKTTVVKPFKSLQAVQEEVQSLREGVAAHEHKVGGRVGRAEERVDRLEQHVATVARQRREERERADSEVRELRDDVVAVGEAVKGVKGRVGEMDTAVQTQRTHIQRVSESVSLRLDDMERSLSSIPSLAHSAQSLQTNLEQLSHTVSSHHAFHTQQHDTIREQLQQTAHTSDLKAMAAEQSLINDALCAENSLGRWLWRSGRTESGLLTLSPGAPHHGSGESGGPPVALTCHEVEVVNTCPDNLLWQSGSTFVVARAPGLYEATCGVFGGDAAKVGLIVNDRKVVETSGRRTIDGGASASAVGGCTMIEYVVLPAQARVSVCVAERGGDRARRVGEGQTVTSCEGFLGLRKL
ncbi:unnamed protein product [Vitrella brassicaformis CCMP3155]|uniref:C1q domain-containing protein n=3 Tax=Vitrella brassicaformis TaxID=1169539 RepID=A0A0G4GVF8_VITBC|nr:unnamed protein product [Vitrella brassicaformis CCMP3155]|eukprot:CEM34797.1 unnamed protein product [Vitrella brassicaformis CCMP3155]